MDLVTCRVVFNDKVSKETAKAVVGKHSETSVLHSFYQDVEVGCNKLCFGIFDIPREDLPSVDRDTTIKGIELLSSAPKLHPDKPSACCTPSG